MKLIIDAGATKTDSVIVYANGAVSNVVGTKGINPVTDQDYKDKIGQLLSIYSDVPKIDTIHFYGSGCISESVNNQVASQISQSLGYETKVFVADDLTGAGVALCGDGEGIVCILGTGSNIGYFNGSEIEFGVKSAGYLLGDEGSGFRIGQQIYLMAVRDQLENSVFRELRAEFDLQNVNLISHLYATHNVRTYLASFSKFINHLDSDCKATILGGVFGDLLQNMIKPCFDKYKCPIHFSGSIGNHFYTELSDLLQNNNIPSGRFLKSPIDGLLAYYKERI